MKIISSRKIHKPSIVKGIGSSSLDFSQTTERKRIAMMEVIAEASRKHPYTFATVDAVSRSIVGSGWKFSPTEGLEEEATEESLAPIKLFFESGARDWSHISDFASTSDKFAQMINSFRLFGHSALEITKTKSGVPVGFDVLSGITFPNLTDKGYFKTPNFTFRPWGGGNPTDFHRDDIIYLWNPGILGNVGGESPYESLANTTLPSDLYAAVAFRELFKNTNSPYNGVWELDPDVSDDDFDYFVELLEERYSGAENYGKNPLVIRGAVNWKGVTSRSEEDAPYLEGRNFSREEFYATTGVDGNKLGTTGTANKSNIRETRREFHENTIRPLVKRLEENLYFQVMIRLFDAPQWHLRFTKPDITTAMEQAAIDMRYMQWGVFSPNEIRVERGYDPREGGNIYYVPLNMAQIESDGTYREPAGRNDGENVNDDDTGDDGSSGGDGSSSDDTRPPRDDENPDSTKLIKELKNWRKYHLRAMDGKKPYRTFRCEYLSDELSKHIQECLDMAGNDFDKVKTIFDVTEEIIHERFAEAKALAVS